MLQGSHVGWLCYDAAMVAKQGKACLAPTAYLLKPPLTKPQNISIFTPQMRPQNPKMPYQRVLIPQNEVKTHYQRVLIPPNEVKMPYQRVLIPRNEVKTHYQRVLIPPNEVKMPYQRVLIPRNQFKTCYQRVLTAYFHPKTTKTEVHTMKISKINSNNQNSRT